MLKRTEFRRLLGLTMAFLTIASWLTLSTYSAGQPAISAAATTAAAAQATPVASIKQIQLATKDIIYDPSRHLIYASVPSRADNNANTLTSINPFTGGVAASYFTGGDPGKLAFSENGQYLYVARDEAGSLYRYNTASLQYPDLWIQLDLGAFTNPYYFVEDMEALPGHPNSIALSLRNLAYRHEGVVIYDDNIRRRPPQETAGETASNVIEFSASASTLYGYNNETSEFGFRKLTVGDLGVSVASTTNNLISGYDVDIEFDKGLIYTTSGLVIDPEAGELRGTFPLDSPSGNLVLPDSKRGRVYFLTGSGASTTLRAFDQRTFAPLGSIPIPGVSGTPGSLIRWGMSGLAFRTDGNQLFLIRTSLVSPIKTVNDFDGDGKTDMALWRPGRGDWLIRQSSNDAQVTRHWGLSSDTPVPGDYDGDYKTDLAVFRPSQGMWYISQSSNRLLRARQWGLRGDKLVPADYDGDGRTDLAVFRPSQGMWYILRSSDNSFRAQQWGISEDRPVPGDYDGDGRTDLAVYRPSVNTFYILRSSDNGFRFRQLGITGDRPTVSDYDGDGKTDLAVQRFSNGYCYILQSSDGSFKALPRWWAGLLISGDYDGDERADLAMFSTWYEANWTIQQSSTQEIMTYLFGANGDIPAQTDHMF